MPLKITLCCLSLVSLVLIVGWLASSGRGAEYVVVSSLVAALPNYSASSWLAPPYLFLTVHFIILLIWKLSDHHKPQGHHQPLPAVPKHNLSVVPAASPAPAPAVAVAVQQGYYQWHPQQQQQEHHPDLSHDNASCTTDDTSDRNSTASSSPLLIRRNERPPPAAVLHKQIPTPPPPEQPALVKEEEKQEEGELIDDVDDSMDATWRAIMAKTSRPVATATATTTTDRTIEPDISAAGADDEMNQRFEEFIKKSRNQMMAMAN